MNPSDVIMYSMLFERHKKEKEFKGFQDVVNLLEMPEFDNSSPDVEELIQKTRYSLSALKRYVNQLVYDQIYTKENEHNNENGGGYDLKTHPILKIKDKPEEETT